MNGIIKIKNGLMSSINQIVHKNKNIIRNYAGKPSGVTTISDIEKEKKNKRRKGSLRGRFLKKIFPEKNDQEALKTIYASLQIQYGHCEERLHSLYGDSEPVIGDPKTISKYILEGLEKESKIEDDEEKEEYQKLRRERQAHFTRGMLWFSKRSGFHASSIEDEIYCKTNHYRLTVPIKIDWNYFDAAIFNNLKPYETSFSEVEKPSFANRAVILVRGKGFDSTTGLFLTEKFDEITTRMARSFIDRSINSARRVLGLKKRRKKLTYLDDDKTKKTTYEQYQKYKQSILGAEDDSRTALSQVEFNGIKTLLGRIKLQEETFEDVLVLYVTRRQLDVENKTYKNIRSVNLRHFQSVPKCDLEFVLPEQAQKVYMRPMDKLLLCFSFIGGTGVASHFFFTGLQFTQAGVIALIGFCAYFIRIFNRYRMSKFYYRSAMAQYLSSNVTGRDRSVIHIVMNESQSHDFVAIASVLNAAWEMQRQYGEKHLDFMSKFIGSDGEDEGEANMGKGAVEIKKLRAKANEYFLMAEAIRHQDGLCDHAFKNALRWLKRMDIITVNSVTGTMSVRTSSDILSSKEKLLGDSLCEEYALESLNAEFLVDKKFA